MYSRSTEMPNKEEKVFYQVYKHGKFYNPANKHYGGQDVGCDRCLKEPITSCIGWGDYDICLDCAGDIEDKYDSGSLIIIEN